MGRCKGIPFPVPPKTSSQRTRIFLARNGVNSIANLSLRSASPRRYKGIPGVSIRADMLPSPTEQPIYQPARTYSVPASIAKTRYPISTLAFMGAAWSSTPYIHQVEQPRHPLAQPREPLRRAEIGTTERAGQSTTDTCIYVLPAVTGTRQFNIP